MSLLKHNTPTRVWINQPSSLQPLHKYHGKVGIAFYKGGEDVTLYFTEGDLISMKVPINTISVKNSHSNVFKVSKKNEK